MYAAASSLRAPRQDDEEFGAERRELPRHVAPRAFADGRQQYDGSDTDGNREQQHGSAQRIPPQRLQGHPRDVDNLHLLILARVADDLAVAQSQMALRPAADRGIVRHEQQCDALGVELLQNLHDLAAGARIEVAGRLVGQ